MHKCNTLNNSMKNYEKYLKKIFFVMVSDIKNNIYLNFSKKMHLLVSEKARVKKKNRMSPSFIYSEGRSPQNKNSYKNISISSYNIEKKEKKLIKELKK